MDLADLVLFYVSRAPSETADELWERASSKLENLQGLLTDPKLHFWLAWKTASGQLTRQSLDNKLHWWATEGHVKQTTKASTTGPREEWSMTKKGQQYLADQGLR